MGWKGGIVLKIALQNDVTESPRLPIFRNLGLVRTSQKLHDATLSEVKKYVAKIRTKKFLQIFYSMTDYLTLEGNKPSASVSVIEIRNEELLVSITFPITGKESHVSVFIYQLLEANKLLKKGDVRNGRWLLKIKLTDDYPVGFKFPDPKHNGNGNGQRSFALHSEMVSLGLL